MSSPPSDEQSSARIVAVVVTFNRRSLLERVVKALEGTPGLAEIVVVDNASTDGTGEWLRSIAGSGFETGARAPSLRDGAEAPPQEVASTSVPVHAVTLAENLGGAGGFHEGMRLALERGADLVWLMDDDGVPVDGSLATLLEHQGDFDFWGPAVLAEQDPARLCFPIRLPGGTNVVHAMSAVEAAAEDGVIADVVIPFNGVLVTRELAERIGLPREEFFIWGDDVEYLWRARKAGARVGTVVAAHFLHPATDDLGTPLMFGRTTYNHSPSDLKHYCMARNNTVNLRDYHGWAHVLAFLLKTVWFYSFTRPSASRLKLSAQAVRAGLRGDFTGHRRFLQ